MVRSLRLVVAISLAMLVLSACDSIVERSKFNATSEQMARVSQSDLVDRAELKINMPRFLAQQLVSLEEQIIATEYDRNLSIETGVCDPDVVVNAFDAGTTFQSTILRSSAIEEDRVIQSVLETSSISDPEAINLGRFDQEHDLGFADFENFLRLITDAMNASRPFLKFRGVKADASEGVSQSPPFVTILAPLDKNLTEAGQAPLLAYVGAYYNGKFVDHFGNTLEKPAFKNGIEDGTIASFTQVIVELLADLPEPRLGTLLEPGTPPTYHPKNVESTFHKMFEKEYELKSNGREGISVTETKLIATGASLIAEQGLTLFSGVLEALSEIHIGFVFAGNFAVGGNDTLKSLARAVIETSLRRGAERGLYCLVEKYDFDAVAEIIDRVT